MAPKSKRAAGATATPSPRGKKPRVDPKLVQVSSALSKAQHLPKQCKEMLVAMLAPSLGKESSERHAMQTAVLGMIMEALQQERSGMQELVAASDKKMEDLRSIQAAKEAEHAAHGAALTEKQGHEQAQRSLLAEAGEARRAAEKAFADAQVAKTQGNTRIESSKHEKEVLVTALQEHYVTPMDAGDGPHYAALKPLLCKLILEDSLVSALRPTCAKPKDQRGSFDDFVLEELRKAFSAKIEELGSLLEAEVPAAEERASKEKEAESELERRKAAEQEITAALEAAKKAVHAAKEEVANSLKVAKGAAADLQAASVANSAVKTELSEFETGPLATFTALKTPQEVSMGEAQPAENAAASA